MKIRQLSPRKMKLNYSIDITHIKISDFNIKPIYLIKEDCLE